MNPVLSRSRLIRLCRNFHLAFLSETARYRVSHDGDLERPFNVRTFTMAKITGIINSTCAVPASEECHGTAFASHIRRLVWDVPTIECTCINTVHSLEIRGIRCEL